MTAVTVPILISSHAVIEMHIITTGITFISSSLTIGYDTILVEI